MKARAVLILAVALGLAACGVGVEDPEGAAAAASHSSALTGTSAPETQGTAAGSGPMKDPSTVYLPQDPIPLFQAKPAVAGPVAPMPAAPVTTLTHN